MPRKARKISSSSVYHVVIRGLDRQIMFECSKDYIKYLDILALYKDECHFELYAYCLMSNHVHLLLKTTDISLETIFRKINTHYAVWFNMKYQRTGHLQQDRYYSEPVEDTQYLLNVIRYIHNNPTKAGIESSPGDSFKWNSIHEYLSENYELIDFEPVLSIVSRATLLEPFVIDDKTKYMDIDTMQKRMPDDVAKELICSIVGAENCLSFCEMDIKKRNAFIRTFHKCGISIRQINRLTGISRGVIQRIIN